MPTDQSPATSGERGAREFTDEMLERIYDEHRPPDATRWALVHRREQHITRQFAQAIYAAASSQGREREYVKLVASLDEFPDAEVRIRAEGQDGYRAGLFAGDRIVHSEVRRTFEGALDALNRSGIPLAAPPAQPSEEGVSEAMVDAAMREDGFNYAAMENDDLVARTRAWYRRILTAALAAAPRRES